MRSFIQYFTNLLHTVNLREPSWDLLILIVWALASVIYAFSAGRGRLINILLSTYVAKLLVQQAYISSTVVGHLPSSWVAFQQLVLFVVCFGVLFVLLGRYGFRTSADGRQMSSLAFGLVFSVLQIGLLLSTILLLLPESVSKNFGELIQFVFMRGHAPLIWLVLPLGFLVLLGKHVADPNEV